MKITTTGIDLAKTIFQIHGVNEHGKVAVRKKLKRAEMLPYFANLPPCLIGMEACNLYLFSKLLIEGLAKKWASMYRVEGLRAFAQSLSNARLD